MAGESADAMVAGSAAGPGLPGEIPPRYMKTRRGTGAPGAPGASSGFALSPSACEKLDSHELGHSTGRAPEIQSCGIKGHEGSVRYPARRCHRIAEPGIAALLHPLRLALPRRQAVSLAACSTLDVEQVGRYCRGAGSSAVNVTVVADQRGHRLPRRRHCVGSRSDRVRLHLRARQGGRVVARNELALVTECLTVLAVIGVSRIGLSPASLG